MTVHHANQGKMSEKFTKNQLLDHPKVRGPKTRQQEHNAVCFKSSAITLITHVLLGRGSGNITANIGSLKP
jgi:hypothetical protein